MKLAKSTWDKEKRTAVSPEALAKAWDYTSLSGPVRTKIAAMRKYGLIEDHESGLRLSDLGMKILHNADDSTERLAAIQEAALKPELFKALRRTHAEASEDAIKSHLVLNKGFSDAGATQCASSFRNTLSIAKLSGSGYSGEEDEGDDVVEKPSDTPTKNVVVTATGNTTKKVNQLATQVLAISIPRNFSVNIDVRGDELKKEDLAKIKSQFARWIEGLEEAFGE